MRPLLKLLLITLPLALVGVGFLAFVVTNRPPPARIALAERAYAVRVITPTARDVIPEVTGFGLVSPARNFEAIPQVAGTAVYVNPDLQKGEILPADTVLFHLSQTDFTLAIAEANANIRAAEARLAELSVTRQNLTAALEIEQATLALKERDLTRAETLFSGGTVSQTALDQAQSALLAQRQKVLNVKSSLSLLPTQHTAQTEQIAAFRAGLDTARLNLGRTELSLPFAARVATVAVEEGQFVRAGTTAAVLDGVDAAEVLAQVSIAEIPALLQSSDVSTTNLAFDPGAMTHSVRQMGLNAVVRLVLGAETLEWPASVDRISDVIDQKSGTLGIIVRVDNAYASAQPGKRPPLTKGMFVEVILQASPLRGIVLPRAALRDGHVLTATPENRLQRIAVDTLLVQQDIAVIKDILPAGTRYLLSIPSPVIEGMLLEVTEDLEMAAQLAGQEPPQ